MLRDRRPDTRPHSERRSDVRRSRELGSVPEFWPVNVNVPVCVPGTRNMVRHGADWRLMRLDHEGLDVYQQALEFLVVANGIIEALPRGRSHLADQFTRASLSVALNRRRSWKAFQAGQAAVLHDGQRVGDLRPSIKPVENGLPWAERLGQIAPGRACPAPPQHCLDEISIVLAWPSCTPICGHYRFKLLPLPFTKL